MKFLFCLFILLAGVSAVADPLPEEWNREELAGEWDVYIVNRREKNLLADYHCRILPDGTAQLIAPDSSEPRLWGKMICDRGTLTLLLPELEPENREGGQAEKRGLIAEYTDGGTIEFHSDFQPDLIFRLERRREENVLTREWLVGSWSLIQKNLVTGEERVAPYELLFTADGQFSFTGREAEHLNAEYAGTWQVENLRLRLNNRCRNADSLWYQTVFFRDGDRLVLNRLDVFVRAERISALPEEGTSSSK